MCFQILPRLLLSTTANIRPVQWSRSRMGTKVSWQALGAKAFSQELFLEQAMAQVEAAGARPVRWYFSQDDVADYARKIFKDGDLENIEVKFMPAILP